jgi:hypothetical protein
LYTCLTFLPFWLPPFFLACFFGFCQTGFFWLASVFSSVSFSCYR